MHMVRAGEQCTQVQPEPYHPNSSFSSPLLPAAQAFRGGLAVQEHLGDPEGETTESEPEEALPLCRGQCIGVRWASRGALEDKRRGRGEKPHTPAGPAARSCPSKVPEHPGWEWGSQKNGRSYRQCLHQAQSCVGRRLAGAQSPMAPAHTGQQVRLKARPLHSGLSS